MLDFTKPVQTRDGLAVTILKTDLRKQAYPVVGVVHYENSDGAHIWAEDGKHSLGATTPLDLIQAPVPPEKRSVWVNVYPPGSGDTFSSTRKAADDYAAQDRIACIELTYEVPWPN